MDLEVDDHEDVLVARVDAELEEVMVLNAYMTALRNTERARMDRHTCHIAPQQARAAWIQSVRGRGQHAWETHARERRILRVQTILRGRISPVLFWGRTVQACVTTTRSWAGPSSGGKRMYTSVNQCKP